MPRRQHGPQHGSRRGGALPKLLLLLFFIGLAGAFWQWKESYGVVGRPKPLPQSTVNTIAFIRTGEGQKADLFIVKADGTGETQLSQDGKAKREPDFSPDGKQIAYAAYAEGEDARAFQIFLHGAGGAQQITQGSGSKSQPRWSPDGKLVAFTVGGEIKVIRPNGADMRQLYPHQHKANAAEGETEGLKQPPVNGYQWSPSGAFIAGVVITEGETATVYGAGNWWEKKPGGPDAPEGPVRTVSEPETLIVIPAADPHDSGGSGEAGGREHGPTRPETNSDHVSFAWFNDSLRIAVALKLPRNEHAILVLRADSPSDRPLTILVAAPNTIAARNPAISPDGSRIAFELIRMESAENSEPIGIAVLPTDTREPVQVSSVGEIGKVTPIVKGAARNPKWSPDGTRLLYTAVDAAGKQDIWVVGADGSNPVNLTKGKGTNSDPVWSPAK
jgi:dipeptidyl aminopeptidase/acylaminoacyl peptidase